MNVILTSCGLETKGIQDAFMRLLKKVPAETKAVFVPTAANDTDAIMVLPKCMNDLLKCGITGENIFVYDLYDPIDEDLAEKQDVVYLCGGSPEYLLRRMNESGFSEKLLAFIQKGGIVIGTSAGSVVLAANLPNNLGLLPCNLDVHCDDALCEKAGRYPKNWKEWIKLGNRQAIVLEEDSMVIID